MSIGKESPGRASRRGAVAGIAARVRLTTMRESAVSVDMRWARRVGVVGFACLLGCSSSSNPKLVEGAEGQACRAGSDCASGLSCIATGNETAACEGPCKSSTDCPSGQVCHVGSPSFCMPHCTDFDIGAGDACVNGVPTACSSITDGSHCTTCDDRCPTGQHCDLASDHCESLQSVGTPCTANADCASANCGIIPGADGGGMTCFVQAGAPCTSENCGSCVLTGTSTACDQSCTAPDDTNCGESSDTCSGSGGSLACLGAVGAYYCRTSCDALTASSCGDGYDCQQYVAPQCSSSLYEVKRVSRCRLRLPRRAARRRPLAVRAARRLTLARGRRGPRRADRANARRLKSRTGPRCIVAASDTCFSTHCDDLSAPAGTGPCLRGSAMPPVTDSVGVPTLCTLLDPPAGSNRIADYCCKDATCTATASVSCLSGTTGYSCTGAATPDLTLYELACPFAASGGSGSFCCEALISGCATDFTVPCGTGQFGYSCVGSSTPASAGSTLSCAAGKTVKGKNEYCCEAPPTCSSSAGIGCDPPSDSDSRLLGIGKRIPPSASGCGVGTVVGTGVTAYCCNPRSRGGLAAPAMNPRSIRDYWQTAFTVAGLRSRRPRAEDEPLLSVRAIHERELRSGGRARRVGQVARAKTARGLV